MSPYRTTARDRAVHALVNWIVRTFATEPYRAFLSVTYAKGKDALDLELANISAEGEEKDSALQDVTLSPVSRSRRVLKGHIVRKGRGNRAEGGENALD